MLKIQSITLLVCLFSFMGFAQENDYIKTASGLQIKIIQEGNGENAKSGDMVTVHYTGKLIDGSVFDSSYKRGTPFTFELGAGRVIKGWDEGIGYLNKGAKATLIIPAELGYGKKAVGSIPSNSVLIFDVELVDIKAAIKIEPYNIVGLKKNSDPSGIEYYIVEQGDGKKVSEGGKVKFNYSAFLDNGKLFDSSIKKGEPLEILAGQGNILKGLDIAVSLMHVGDKYRCIVPPELGFGSKGNSIIPPNSSIIFDIEILDAKDEIQVKPFDTKGKKIYQTETGLRYIIVRDGKGAQPKAGQEVKLHYTGYLQNGEIFDSSVKRDEPFTFTLGSGQVIKGWEEGVALMRVGDKMRLIIPPELAYGQRAMGKIPENATLTFDIELLDSK